MLTNSIRFALSLAAIATGVVVLAFAGSKSRAVRDPSLRFLRIPIIPELLYTSFEAAFIAFALAGKVALPQLSLDRFRRSGSYCGVGSRMNRRGSGCSWETGKKQSQSSDY